MVLLLWFAFLHSSSPLLLSFLCFTLHNQQHSNSLSYIGRDEDTDYSILFLPAPSSRYSQPSFIADSPVRSLDSQMPHLKSSAGGAYERYVREQEYKKYRSRVVNATAAVDSSLPYSTRYRRGIKPPPITAADKAIARNNVFYFDRLDQLSEEPSSIDHHTPRKTYEKEFFTQQARDLEHERIEEENVEIMERILNTQTCYPLEKSEEAFAKNRVIAERIRRYEDD